MYKSVLLWLVNTLSEIFPIADQVSPNFNKISSTWLQRVIRTSIYHLCTFRTHQWQQKGSTILIPMVKGAALEVSLSSLSSDDSTTSDETSLQKPVS